MATSTHPAPRNEAVPLLTAGGVVALLLPGVLVGMGTGELLRARRLRWTWTLPLVVLVAAVVVFLAPAAGQRLVAWADAIGHGGLTAELWVAAWWVPWLAATPLAALSWMRHRDRRARLRGGSAERALQRQRGPFDTLRGRLDSHRPQRAALVTDAGILLGSDERGRPVRVARPHAHTTIVGASGSGKTTTAKVLLSAQVAAGGGLVVLDGKGGTDLPRHLLELGRRHGRPVVLWSPLRYGDPQLDALRRAWNPCSDGSATEVKDRIAAAEPQSEPYYAAIAARGLHAAATLLETEEALDLEQLAAWLGDPPTLAARCADAGNQWRTEEAWLGSLTDGERSGLRGIATRLATMTRGPEGAWLLPHHPHGTLLLSQAIRERALVCFSLPQGALPALVPHVGRYLMATLNAVASRLETSGTPGDGLVLVDELSALDGEQLTAGLERGRSAGLRYVLATQSLGNFETSGGPRLAAAALDNAELVVIHRQATPQAIETLASLGGTEEAWEHTHHAAGPSHIGHDDTGQRNRRLVDRYRAHPNHIRELRTGEAIVVETRPQHRVRRVCVGAQSTR